MNETTRTAEIKRKTGVVDLSKMTQSEASQVFHLAGQQGLDKADVQLILQLVPQFAAMALVAAKTQLEVAKGAAASQAEALQVLKSFVEGANKTFENLAANAETDETRLAIAGCIIELARICVPAAQDLNADNNEHWKNFTTWLKRWGPAIAASVAGAAGYAAGHHVATQKHKGALNAGTPNSGLPQPPTPPKGGSEGGTST